MVSSSTTFSSGAAGDLLLNRLMFGRSDYGYGSGCAINFALRSRSTWHKRLRDGDHFGRGEHFLRNRRPCRVCRNSGFRRLRSGRQDLPDRRIHGYPCGSRVTSCSKRVRQGDQTAMRFRGKRMF
ncbi:hypothetical protein HMSSN036_82950 [Paenibacillus macerans]|nr:hypothetical protein HMSSN036_82950 [Paenibacillus macerans]